MILRRFTEHVKQQNWFAVWLDLVVVVAGIYIGLQADAWMSAQKDREIEREYLERLLADMDESIEAQRNDQRIFDASLAATDYVAEIQRAGTFDDVDRASTTVSSSPPVTNMITIRELQSTGNISLIRDVSVRTAIGRFQRSYDAAAFSAEHALGFMFAAAPEFMEWSYLEPRTPGEHHSVTEAEDPSFGYVQRHDAKRMLKNPVGANITSWVSGWGKYHGAVLVQHHDATIEFRDLLKEKLEN